MANEKKYSAQEAGRAVLAKVEEMLKAHKVSTLAKSAVNPPEGVQGTPDPVAHPPAEQRAGGNPEPGVNPPPTVKAGLKGPLKLAKFIGRMEEKRKNKVAAPNG